MHEQVVIDDDGREVLVRSHTGTVVSVRDVITQGRVEIAISVDPPDERPGGLRFPVKSLVAPDDPLLAVAASSVGKPVRWIIEWRRLPDVADDVPIREAYRRDRAAPVLVSLDPLDAWDWTVPDTVPGDWA